VAPEGLYPLWPDNLAERQNKRHGIEPEKVALAVEHALSSRRPHPRYRVGQDLALMELVMNLPVAIRDRLIAGQLPRYGNRKTGYRPDFNKTMVGPGSRWGELGRLSERKRKNFNTGSFKQKQEDMVFRFSLVSIKSYSRSVVTVIRPLLTSAPARESFNGLPSRKIRTRPFGPVTAGRSTRKTLEA